MDANFYDTLLDKNKEWVKEKIDSNPDFFKKLRDEQNPPILWIGCSDSRVSANQIIGEDPGEIFVHRNIANMVIHTDINMLSVLDYAVNVLKVRHIIVCGHYNCGGMKAAMSNEPVGIIDNWIRHIKDVYRFNNVELDAIEDETERLNTYTELNIREQVYNLAKTYIVQAAWEKKQFLHLHGWIYNIGNGLIKDLGYNLEDNNDLTSVYKLNGLRKNIGY